MKMIGGGGGDYIFLKSKDLLMFMWGRRKIIFFCSTSLVGALQVAPTKDRCTSEEQIEAY